MFRDDLEKTRRIVEEIQRTSGLATTIPNEIQAMHDRLSLGFGAVHEEVRRMSEAMQTDFRHFQEARQESSKAAQEIAAARESFLKSFSGLAGIGLTHLTHIEDPGKEIAEALRRVGADFGDFGETFSAQATKAAAIGAFAITDAFADLDPAYAVAAFTSDDSDQQREAEEVVVGWLARTIAKLPADLRRSDFLVGLLLALLTVAHAQMLAMQGSRELAALEERMTRRFERIASHFNENEPNDNDALATFLQAARPLNLRDAPDLQAVKITQLVTGQPVKLLRIDGRWMLVEAIDYRSGKPTSGWAYAKFLKPRVAVAPPESR
jgi:Bacterial SH3 domain